MPYIYDPPNLTTGLDSTIIEIASEVEAFTPMLLLFIFGLIFLGGAVSQKRRTGSADIPMWAVVASLGTLMIALPMTLSSGLIQPVVLSIVVAITIMTGFWLFLDRNRNEV